MSITGNTIINNNATFSVTGNVTLGNASADTITMTGQLNSDLVFATGIDRIIQIANSATGTNGNLLTIKGSTPSGGSANGGGINITGGAAFSATLDKNGGTLNLDSGAKVNNGTSTINIGPTNATVITIGNTSKNPTFSFNGTGVVTVGGTLGVTGATTLAGLTAGASTLSSLTVTNNASIGGTLNVPTGATTLVSLTASTGLTLTTGALNLTATSGTLDWKLNNHNSAFKLRDNINNTAFFVADGVNGKIGIGDTTKFSSGNTAPGASLEVAGNSSQFRVANTSGQYFQISTAITGAVTLTATGTSPNIAISNLGGSGTKIVQADNIGILSVVSSVGATQGGTGLTGYTLGDLLYSSASNTLATLSGNTSTTKKFLSQTGDGSISAAPVWSSISLATDVSGLVPIANGGTGVSSAFALGSVIFSDGSKLAENSTNLNWDNTNNVLMISKIDNSNPNTITPLDFVGSCTGSQNPCSYNSLYQNNTPVNNNNTTTTGSSFLLWPTGGNTSNALIIGLDDSTFHSISFYLDSSALVTANNLNIYIAYSAKPESSEPSNGIGSCTDSGFGLNSNGNWKFVSNINDQTKDTINNTNSSFSTSGTITFDTPAGDWHKHKLSSYITTPRYYLCIVRSLNTTSARPKAFKISTEEHTSISGDGIHLVNSNLLIGKGSLCVHSIDSACVTNPTIGGIYADKLYGTLADFAENYISNTNSPPGTIVQTANDGNNLAVHETDKSYSNNLLGVVSTDPGVTINSNAKSDDAHPYILPIALSGRVPVKVNLENGPIAVGDYLTSSSTPGVAMKATKTGTTIGMALENYDGTDTDNDLNNPKIMIFVSRGFYNPNVKLAEDLIIKVESLADATARFVDDTGAQTFAGKFFGRLTTWFGDATNGIGDFFANRIRTKNICVGDDSGAETCITKSELDRLLQNNSVTPSTTPPPESVPLFNQGEDSLSTQTRGGNSEPTPEIVPTPKPEVAPETIPTPEPTPDVTSTTTDSTTN